VHPFYNLMAATAPPTPPQHWTFSSLQAWRDCPRRWWLLRAHYPNAPTPYPQRVFLGALQGRLVHDAILAFAQHIRAASAVGQFSYPEVRQTFRVRQVMRDRLRMISQELERNPRVDPRRLTSKVSLDDCVNAFKRIVSALPLEALLSRESPVAMDEEAEEGPETIAEKPRHARVLTEGHEVWLEVPAPPIAGRLDRSNKGMIVDYKTGDPQDSDREQLRFYAVLFWLATGCVPVSLVSVYGTVGTVVRHAVPDRVELESLRDAYSAEITAAVRELTRGLPRALPEEDKCRKCAVRQVCDVYWASSLTSSLRSTDWPAGGEEDPSRWLDVALDSLPNQSLTGEFMGGAISHDLGPVQVTIDAMRSPAHGHRPQGARLLGARVQSDSQGICVSTGTDTEVFWIGLSLDQRVTPNATA
jgi:CRISPR/Cas system-associated exonuclease Cas4 (RecB family)